MYDCKWFSVIKLQNVSYLYGDCPLPHPQEKKNKRKDSFEYVNLNGVAFFPTNDMVHLFIAGFTPNLGSFK